MGVSLGPPWAARVRARARILASASGLAGMGVTEISKSSLLARTTTSSPLRFSIRTSRGLKPTLTARSTFSCTSLQTWSARGLASALAKRMVHSSCPPRTSHITAWPMGSSRLLWAKRTTGLAR